MANLTTYNSLQQQYGDYFAGFRWTIIGCGTFKSKVSLPEAQSRMKLYMRCLGNEIKARIPYIAVCEHRFSGCGQPAISAHFHFVAACPKQWEDMFPYLAKSFWFQQCGNAKVERYLDSKDGTHYMAKLASNEKFEFVLDNLDLLSYHGPTDLIDAATKNPYVPKHAHGIARLTTLVVRNPITGLPV
jgi:hypothetical protein